MNRPEHEEMSSTEKNMGFIFNSRLLDALLTLACVALAALGFYMSDDMMIAYAIPAAIGLFRQVVALLTFPYVVSIGIATILTTISLPLFAALF
jgi:hypothetical protein